MTRKTPASSPQKLTPSFTTQKLTPSFTTVAGRYQGSQAASSNAAQMQKKVPGLAAGLELLAQLPLSGRALHAAVTDAANAIRSCEIEPAAGQLSCFYGGSKVVVPKNPSTGMLAHEYFHAYQDINGAFSAIDGQLTVEDAGIAYLLNEAVACAYEMIVRAEAVERGLTLAFNFRYAAAADSRDLHKLFMETYGREMGTGKGGGERFARALEKAGQSIVRHLMNGGHEKWLRQYVGNAAEQLFDVSGFRDGKAPDYAQTRDSVFALHGHVSEALSLVPPEFMGADAAPRIAALYTRHFTAPPQKEKPTAKAAAGMS